MKTSRKIIYLRSLIFVSIVFTWLIFLFFSDDMLISLTKEDGIVESLGAFFLLVASVIFFITFLRDTNSNDFFFWKTNKNYFFLFFAILFFLAFGEELSWGQRIFNFRSPQILDQLNYQHEFNLHNLKIFSEFGFLNANHIATFLGIVYCFIIPLFYYKSSVAAKLLDRINLPVVPGWLAIFFLFSYSVSLTLKILGYTQSVTEVKEASVSYLFAIFSIICLTDKHHRVYEQHPNKQ